MINREKALAIVHEYVKSESLIKHMYCVEAALRFYAEMNHEDIEKWGITGLLHDFDWEIHPTMETHPSEGAPILRSQGVDEEIIQAILSHGEHLHIPRVTPLEKTLFACDEITGLITAVALVRPSRSLYDLEASSVKKKWKDKTFAAGANRSEIEQSAAELGIPLWDHCSNVIHAMQLIAPVLGLEGSIARPENLKSLCGGE